MNTIKELFGYNIKPLTYNFIKENPDINERQKESSRMMERFPQGYPIICEKDPRGTEKIEELKKTKLMPAGDVTLSQFSHCIKKLIIMDSWKSLFILINGKYTATGDKLIKEIYEEYKDSDGFLYITYAPEIIWG